MPTEKRHSQDCRMYAMICSEIDSSIFHERHLELCVNITKYCFLCFVVCHRNVMPRLVIYWRTPITSYWDHKVRNFADWKHKIRTSHHAFNTKNYIVIWFCVPWLNCISYWWLIHAFLHAYKINNFVFSHSSTCCFHFHWCSLCQVGRMLQWF